MTTGHTRILAISIVCMLYACLVDSASAQPQAPRTVYMFCLSHPNPPDTSYFSGIFVFDPSDAAARAWNAENEKGTRERGPYWCPTGSVGKAVRSIHCPKGPPQPPLFLQQLQHLGGGAKEDG